MLRRNCRNRRFNLRGWLRFSLGFRLGNRRTLQEVIAQRSSEIRYKLAHGLCLRNAKARGGRVSDRLKFFPGLGLNFVLWRVGLRRSVLDGRFRFMRNRPRKEALAERG